MKTLTLKKGEDRRLRTGHLWIFSNEVDTSKTPLKEFEPGEAATVVSASGEPVGSATVNPGSLISARIFSRRPGKELGPEMLEKRIASALALRETLFDEPCYRLVFSEADFLPGLIVDRYGDVCSVQLTTAGLDSRKDMVVDVLTNMLGVKGIIMKNDSSSRALEGLPSSVEEIGQVPGEVELVENGIRYVAPLAAGQKTGWFYDQRDNRRAFMRLAKDADVLDVFSYAGSFGIAAAVAGAKRVVCVDSSAVALEYVRKNAELNGVADLVETVQGDAFKALDELRADGGRFNAVSLDPPAFIKKKKDKVKGFKAYVKANRETMKLIPNGGFLASCSCSQHMGFDDLRVAISKAAQQRRAKFQIIRQGHQGPDHPVLPSMPETHYLKSFSGRVLK